MSKAQKLKDLAMQAKSEEVPAKVTNVTTIRLVTLKVGKKDYFFTSHDRPVTVNAQQYIPISHLAELIKFAEADVLEKLTSDEPEPVI